MNAAGSARACAAVGFVAWSGHRFCGRVRMERKQRSKPARRAPSHARPIRYRCLLVAHVASSTLLCCSVDDRSFKRIDGGPSSAAMPTPMPNGGSGGNPEATGGVGGSPAVAVDSGGGQAEPNLAACAEPNDCAQSHCAGASCGEGGRVCQGGACICPGGSAFELACGDERDDDCDGASDCADPDCEGIQCAASTTRRCCSGACVDTATNGSHCQGCGLACAPAQQCVLVSDESGVRGHCTCFASTECPGYPNTICRKENEDGQDDLCACDFLNTVNDGCAAGQVCADVPRANFCRYP